MPATHAASKTNRSLDWIQLPESITTHWTISIDPHDRGKWHLASRWQTSKPDKKILMLLPKKSGSYQLAIIEFLGMMKRNNIPASITLYHFNNELRLGLAALNQAEADQIDLVFSMGSETANLVHENFSNSQVPVVISTSKDPVELGMMPDYDSGSGTNIAYTSLNIPTDVAINYLLSLRPKLKVIGLLYNQNHKQVMATEVIPLKQKMQDLGHTVVDITVTSAKTAGQELAQNMPIAIQRINQIDPGAQNSLLWITSSTAVFSEIPVVNQFSANIPVLGANPNIVRKGTDSAVIAIGIDRRNNAYLASIYAKDILNNKVKPGQLKVGIVTPPDIAINFLIAKKIGLRIPFDFFESASFIYNYDGLPARSFGQRVQTIE
ncbi:MAG: hypothetical protein KUG79_00195 [Pseudomonadales bacterium]|nr:hypothetical protein [Pseudomonadales bacterium]